MDQAARLPPYTVSLASDQNNIEGPPPPPTHRRPFRPPVPPLSPKRMTRSSVGHMPHRAEDGASSEHGPYEQDLRRTSTQPSDVNSRPLQSPSSSHSRPGSSYIYAPPSPSRLSQAPAHPGPTQFTTSPPSPNSDVYDMYLIETKDRTVDNGDPRNNSPSSRPNSFLMGTTDHPEGRSDRARPLLMNGDRSDSRYSTYSRTWDPRISQATIEPDCIDDEDEDMLAFEKQQTSREYPPKRDRKSKIPFISGFGAMQGSGPNSAGRDRDGSGKYNSLNDRSTMQTEQLEKSAWLHDETKGRNRLRWLAGTFILVAVIAGIIGGVYGGLKSRASPGSSSSLTSAAHDDAGSDFDKNSAQVKKLMNNPDLHRIMPGVDYTPYNAQYPDCLTNPPSQNNVTLDVAVLSQLTNTIRMYGTDCNQTEMVLHSISKLGLTDMKVWIGVWLDKNSTTNDRGLQTMYELLDKNGADPFAGVIVGNEVLFRKDLTADQMAEILTSVRSNMTAKNIKLPLAAADLGDSWSTSGLAKDVDVVMSNIHPFFAGQPADTASAWTWNFWQKNDVALTTGTNEKNIISEVGWPSGGGTDCGGPDTCEQGSVAGIDGMNTFMDSFICQSLANGTNFFWFEAFDQPWQARLNTPGKEWEDKWGLMDASRKIKSGLKIPDCGGKTIG